MKQFLKKLVLTVVTLALCCNLVPMAFAADANYYNVYLEAQGGSCEVMQLYAYKMGSKYRVTSIPTPTMDGYKFDGWYIESDTDPDGTKLKTTTDITGDTTVYAHWVPTGKTTEAAQTTAEAQPGTGWKLKDHIGTVMLVGTMVVIVTLAVSQAS